jgi:hypothetical protein
MNGSGRNLLMEDINTWQENIRHHIKDAAALEALYRKDKSRFARPFLIWNRN